MHPLATLDPCRAPSALTPSLRFSPSPPPALALASIIAAFLQPPKAMTPEIRKWRVTPAPAPLRHHTRGIYFDRYAPLRQHCSTPRGDIRAPAHAQTLTFFTPLTCYTTPQRHNNKTQQHFPRCLIFMGIAVGSFFAGLGQMWSLGVIGADLAKNARAAAFRQILRMEMGFFDKEENSSGRLTMKLEEDAVYIRGAVSDQISVVAQNLTVLAAGLIIAFCYSWKLSLVIIATLPALIGAASMQMIMLTGFGGETEKLFSTTKQLLSDALGNMRTVCAYGLDAEMARCAPLC